WKVGGRGSPQASRPAAASRGARQPSPAAPLPVAVAAAPQLVAVPRRADLAAPRPGRSPRAPARASGQPAAALSSWFLAAPAAPPAVRPRPPPAPAPAPLPPP